MRILDDERAYKLHWKGSKKKARSCWTHVCEQLASHVFVAPEAGEAFRQKTVDEFLLAAGYVVAAAASNSSGSNDIKEQAAAAVALPAAAASSSSGKAGTKQAAAAATVPATEKPAAATGTKDLIPKRFAYSELDQLARSKIAATDWFWATSREDCEHILASFENYQCSNTFADRCLNLSAVVMKVRLSVHFLSQSKLWPSWLMHPSDKLLKQITETEDAYVDPGNEVWELMVNLMGLSSAMQSVGHQQRFNAAPHAPYGDRSNKSGVGNYNFRGNVLERLLSARYRHAQEQPSDWSAKRARR